MRLLVVAVRQRGIGRPAPRQGTPSGLSGLSWGLPRKRTTVEWTLQRGEPTGLTFRRAKKRRAADAPLHSSLLLRLFFLSSSSRHPPPFQTSAYRLQLLSSTVFHHNNFPPFHRSNSSLVGIGIVRSGYSSHRPSRPIWPSPHNPVLPEFHVTCNCCCWGDSA